MKKQLTILIIVLLAVFMAIGCTSTDTEDQPITEENITGAEDEITGAVEDIEENVTEAGDEIMENDSMGENESMDEELI
ncbi:MAG: hypothetical protein AWU59_2155 [Methanolobus sp. T82-4]|nr:MAG: hypothetical protein AWU59_2155 [Methanolobus sp. T82-4]